MAPSWGQRLTPVDVTGLTSGVTMFAAGNRHTCALTAGGAVSCWGDDSANQLGDIGSPQRLVPALVAGQPSVKGMSAGGLHTCAIVGGGAAKCWGANDSGQLGDNSVVQRTAPVAVSGLAAGVAAIVTGATHSCALTVAGGVKCWGANANGQLGDSTTTQRLTPVDGAWLGRRRARDRGRRQPHVRAHERRRRQVLGPEQHGPARRRHDDRPEYVPVNVSGLTSGVIAIDAGAAHTCALTTGSGVKCWGWNGFGQIGDNTTTEQDTPVDVVGLTSGVSAIAVGQYHTCALAAAASSAGAGTPTASSATTRRRSDWRRSPSAVSQAALPAITAGNGHTCATDSPRNG